ncbi:hypothetical protein [Saccharopolyspora sp. NPDC002376]
MRENALNLGPEPLARDQVVSVARGRARAVLTQLWHVAPEIAEVEDLIRSGAVRAASTEFV